jgi:predicted PhzF superfamily epimerase YddE/YHI9
LLPRQVIVARFEYRLVDVFTPLAPRATGETWRPAGNPLAVFPDGRGIDPVLMQRVAFELNLSETTFVLPTSHPDCDVRVQIFTPRAEHGIAEDPATGAAAGPLGAYWRAHGLAMPPDDGVLRLTFTQGVELGRPSELFVEVEGAAIRVAGACHAVGGGWFEF